ncbi:uncharacterized protein SRS1_21043 [Sporisorium reilianum f. sp. reilianum]|uniref:Uncharacterized protein n=1 Tax=Sporisorium reilianum f. sp. reilianum TaxID=72559 RepID=A0A2N8U887_9BASI|nr:uncharacterized protein SRS1_21043 [Sporisorium reilianum f. sp. reilianum]
MHDDESSSTSNPWDDNPAIDIFTHERHHENIDPSRKMVSDATNPPSSRPAAKEELYPKSLTLDRQLMAQIYDMWQQFRKIGRSQRQCSCSRLTYNSKTLLHGESDAGDHVYTHIMLPLADCMNGLIDCSRAHAVAPEGVDPKLLRLFHAASAFTVRSQGPRDLGATPILDRQAIADRSMDLGTIAHPLYAAGRLHQVVQSLATQHDNQPGDTHLYSLSDAQAIEKAKAESYLSKSVPDFTMYWYCGKDGAIPEASSVTGAIPALVVEMKDPYRFTHEAIANVLTNFHVLVEDGEMRVRFQRHGTIPVREVINRRLVDSTTAHVLQNICHLVRHMFFKRQTYGIWSTGSTSLALKLHWYHLTHPSQHVTYAIMASGDPDTHLPNWPGHDVRGDKYHFFGGTLGLQAVEGLVPMCVFDDALRRLVGEHDGWFPPTTSQGSDSGDDGDRPVDGEQRMTRSKTRALDASRAASAGQRSNSASNTRAASPSATSRSGFDINQALFDCIADEGFQAEICCFVELDETQVTLKFRKSELAKLLCAAFPLHLGSALAEPTNELSREQLSALVQPERPAWQKFSDFDLFTWGTLREGYLPRGFNARLAQLDELERTRSMLEHSWLSTPSAPDDDTAPRHDSTASSPETPPTAHSLRGHAGDSDASMTSRHAAPARVGASDVSSSEH